MKPIHIPRSILIIILFAIGLAFLFGTFRAFDSVNAANIEGAAGTSRLEITPTPTEAEGPTPTATPILTPPSADTTGIIVLAIVIVAVVVWGSAWGGRRPARKK